MKLIVGLGNPGKRYLYSRHNMGFLAIDKIAEDYGISVSHKDFDALYGKGRLIDTSIILAKPLTYMNLSGLAVRRLFEYFQPDNTSDVILIHDDLDLPFGTLRVKAKGGHGGHKGLISVIEALGTQNFVRIRLGIGRPPMEMRAEEYVLDRFSPEEMERLEDVLTVAKEAVFVTVTSGVQAAMNKYNGKAIN